jgi:hypothetical protein
MPVSRLIAGFLLVAACSSSTGPRSGGPAAAGSPDPTGPEFFSLSQGSFQLAPGREAWLYASSFIKVSSTQMVPVTPKVSFESSDPSVASITLDSAGLGHIMAHNVGTATISARSDRPEHLVRTATVTVAQAPVGDESGLVYAATAAVRPTFQSMDTIPLGPTTLDVHVIISNPTPATRDIYLSGCAAWIRVYTNSNYSGAPIGDVPHAAQCQAGMVHHIIAPGRADTVPAEGYRLDISGDTLPTGRYYIAAALDRLRDLYNVPAGPVDIVSPNFGLTFTAATTVANDTLKVHATVTNTNAQPVRLEYGACAVDLRAYRTSDRSGKPAWDSALRRSYPPPGFSYACPLYLATGKIDPGATLSPAEFNTRIPVTEMLGDSLPAGHYYFTALVGMNWRTNVVPAGEADVAK